MTALRANDLQTAERRFLEFLEVRPEHAGALGNLGVVYSRTARYADAVRVYTQALQRAPHDPDLNLNLGLAWLKQDNHRRAREYFERALQYRPDHLQTRELLATTQLFTGDADTAVNTLEGLDRTPGVLYLLSIAYLRQNRQEEAEATIRHMFSSLQPAQAHLLAGRAFYESTLFEDAARELTKARELDPDLPGLWREIGKTSVSLRQSREARQALEEAARRDRSDVEARYFLGALLLQDGEEARGVELLEQTREARPEFWGSWYYLGKNALGSRNYSQAVELFRRAAELNPDEHSVLYGLLRALRAAGKHSESRAVASKLTQLQDRTRVEAEEALVLK